MLIRRAGRQLAADARRLSTVAARRPATPAIDTVTRKFLAKVVLRTASRPVGIRTYATAGSATPGLARKARKASPAKGKKASKTPAKKAKAAPKKKKKTTTASKKVKSATALTKERRSKISELKAAALLDKEPVVFATGYTVFLRERWQQGTSGTGAVIGGARTQEIAAEWKGLAAGDKERFKARASEHRAALKQQHEAWVAEYSVEQLHRANRARRSLNLANKTLVAESKRRIAGVKRQLSPIKDERLPRRPGNAYTIFYSQHVGQSEFTSVPVTTRAKELGARWKAMSASEQKPYHDQAATDRETYKQAKQGA